MLIIEDFGQLPEHLQYPVLTIGVFDGVHLGHQAILRRVIERAQEKDGSSLLLTFVPHPQKVISSTDAPLLLQSDEQKQRILQQFRIDIMIKVPFTRKISLYSPEQFARDVLYNHGVREIYVGGNFRFGHRRSGDFATLKALGRKFRFAVHKIQPVQFRTVPVSSTRIRQLLKQGDVSLAKRLIGRPYQLHGTVVRGSRKGVALGFPTANLDPENELIPAVGVYASRAHVDANPYVSVTNVGYRPTLHQDYDQGPVVETHLLNFEGSFTGNP